MGRRHRGPGRPRTRPGTQDLVVWMATENRDWAIAGSKECANLGHVVGRSTIANILKAHGLEPAPERNGKTTWKEFLVGYWDVLAAVDFFSIEIWTRKGLHGISYCF